ncbi:MarR family transcriptional regulator [Winogradskyella echinorum]|uniref:MarR family transcriptional regulator n=1 Tax=Winogradskyella echinorum TaxID=538189 RepID=A0ABR6XWJ5_9FLAO|nr:MarR family transcriptional regulator [Winogradskyella echinorum]MBC3844872.1 MarR family transcriptional regulator [Winogradskyella echinorum]MBC5749220.1 MarR family transcriptional regulator [Winogradskyella echinorum]
MKELNKILKSNAKFPLSQETVINIFLTNIWIKDDLLLELKPFDLSLEQFNVLRILRGQKGKPINLQDIQERMISKMSNTTRLVDKLIKKKFVRRTICKTNRRKVEIVITDLGLKTLKKVDPIIHSTEEKLTKNLTPDELIQLNKLLIKLKNQ